ncbi:acetone carboxylase subunit gamma [bacterium]|nr:MAG: acetone carboxylase subunit gamma [bacterium]
MEKVEKQIVEQLVSGDISRDESRRLLKMDPKDPERFWTYLEVLQDRVKWKDKILLRISDHLYIVKKEKTGERLVKCECGHELGDYRVNWKTAANVRIRATQEEMSKVYFPATAVPEPKWNEIREFFCPNCFTQIGVEVVPPGYPLLFEFLPDLDRFYSEFLGRPLDDAQDDWYENQTNKKTAAWL